eukprot:SAG22_NODE_5298_length_1042_cov_1.057264_2_plen_88_part_00
MRSCAVDDPRKPERPKHIRAFMAQYGRLYAVPGEPHQHVAEMFLCTDLKGQIPASVVNKGFVMGMDASIKNFTKLYSAANPDHVMKK